MTKPMPNWAKNKHTAKLWQEQPEWRDRITAATTPQEQWEIAVFAAQWVRNSDVITLSEGERRWGRVNLRRNSLGHPFRWQASDAQRTWLTTVGNMEKAFGPEPKQMEAAQ